MDELIAKAEVLYKDKKWQEAFDVYQVLLEKYEGNVPVDVYAKMAIAQRHLKDYIGSEKTLQKGLEKFTDNTWLLIEYAALENTRKNWVKAVEFWEKAKVRSKNWSLLNYQRYLLALENVKGKRKDLEVLLYEAIELFPANEKLLAYIKKYPKLKIAIQFYGHSRSFKQTFLYFKKNVIDVNLKNGIAIDVFIHTWDEKEHTTIKPHYKKDFSYAGKKLTQDDIEFIKNSYKPKELLIEPQQKISVENKKKIESLGFAVKNYEIINNISYTMFKVNELRKKYDEQYDFVLLTRLDIIFLKPLSFIDLTGNRIKRFMDFDSKKEFENVVFYPYMETNDLYRNQNKYITGIDLLLLSTPNVVDKVCSWHKTLFDRPPRGTENALTYILHENNIERHLLYYSKPDCWTILRTNDNIFGNQNIDVKNKLKLNWNFSGLELFYEESLRNNNLDLFEYIVYLADIGKLDKLDTLINKYGNDYIDSLVKNDLYSSDKKPNVAHMLSFYKMEYRPNRVSIQKNSFESKIIYYTAKNDKNSLLYLQEFLLQEKSVFKVDGKMQMLLNFTLNKLIENKLLNVSFAYNLIEHYAETTKINKTRKKYVTASLIDYFESHDADIFFKYLYSKKGYIQKIASTIHRFGDNEKGAKYYQNKLHKLVKLVSINYKIKKNSPKIAVCISGMIRGAADKVMDKIEKNIIRPLSADVFVHTWNVQHKWMGIGGDVNWVYRLFGSELLEKCPNELKHISFLQKNFPHTYKKLEEIIAESLDVSDLKKLIDFKEAIIENENTFLDILSFPRENLMSRGHFNQAKMFYGIYKAMKLMEDYEYKNKFKYDYVVRCRPDIGLNNELTIEALNSLEENEILVDFFPYGPQDQFRAGKRDTMMTLANIWEAMLHKEKLSPFDEYPDIDAHNLIYLWMIQNDIITVPASVKRDVSLAARYSKLPSISAEIEFDFKQLSTEYRNRTDFKDFFQLLMEKK